MSEEGGMVYLLPRKQVASASLQADGVTVVAGAEGLYTDC